MQAQKVKTLTKRELIESLSCKSIVSKKDVDLFLHSFFEIIAEALQQGTKVQLAPFGTFLTRVRASKKVRNPKTGQMVEVQTSRVALFKPGKKFWKCLE